MPFPPVYTRCNSLLMACNGLVAASTMGDFFIDGCPINSPQSLAASDHVGVISIWIVSRITVSQVVSMLRNAAGVGTESLAEFCGETVQRSWQEP